MRFSTAQRWPHFAESGQCPPRGLGAPKRAYHRYDPTGEPKPWFSPIAHDHGCRGENGDNLCWWSRRATDALAVQKSAESAERSESDST